MMRNFLKKEKGSVSVIVALAMTLFITLLAFVIDVGSLYLEKSRLQNIVDASALAGAQELPGSFSKSQEEVNKTIQLNNENPAYFMTSITKTVIEVTGSKKGTFFFAKAFGVEEPIVQAKAKVALQPLISGKEAIPLGVQPSTDLLFGSLQTLKVSDSANGNFGAIALTGPGAKDYETDLKNGYQFDLKVGTTLDTQTGQLAGPTTKAINARLALCPNATYLNYPNNCARVVLVPIYEPVQSNQNQIKQVKIVGFGSFFLEGVSSTSEGAVVTGRFIERTYPGESSVSQTGFGTSSFILIR
jgi:hypothetical protein